MTEKKATAIINSTKAESLYLLFCLPKHILAAKAGSAVLTQTRRLQLKQEC